MILKVVQNKIEGYRKLHEEKTFELQKFVIYKKRLRKFNRIAASDFFGC